MPKTPLCGPIDIHIGARVKLRRRLMGLSQSKLGAAIGLTFQQMQKYERGQNRISASTLYRLAEALDVPVSFFYDGLGNGPGSVPAGIGPEALELIHYYDGVPAPLRRTVLGLIKAMARPSS